MNAEGRLRLRAKRAAVGILAACLGLSAAIVALDLTGATAIINTLLCQRTGDTYYFRGRFGTYPRLPDAVAAARPHDIIEARFSGEELVDSFRVGRRPLTIRAAKGFRPILVATNNAQPMILADAPLTLEGMTLWRRGPRVNFAALISVEKAPLHLLNCRILRSRFPGQDVLVYGRLRVTPAADPPHYRALIAFQHGSVGYLRNCLVVGTQATAIGLRASTNEPTRVELENNVSVIDRTFSINPEAETGLELKSADSVFLTGGLLDLGENGSVGISATWQDCLVDRTRGALLRLNQAYDGVSLHGLEWKETNVVYAGRGAYVVNRRRRALDSETDWNAMFQLAAGSHRLTDRQAFQETCVRSALELSAADLDAEAVKEFSAGRAEFAPQFIGEGGPYEAYRESSGYREWRERVRIATREWEQRRYSTAMRH